METPLNFPLLKKLTEAHGTSGFEHTIRQIIREEVADYADRIDVDNLGNLVVFREGYAAERKKVVVDAHMDEIGFMVTHIDDNGFVYIHTLGGFDPKTLTSARVIIHGRKPLVGVFGSKGAHSMTVAERNKAPKLDDYFIDTGLPKEEVEKFVSVGDSVTRVQETIEIGDCINGKSIDNRLSVFALIEVVKRIEKTPHDFYAVFSVQEEVGVRGAEVAAKYINPDFSIVLDTTIANDLPGQPGKNHISKLGSGAAIKLMDGSFICDIRMVDFLKTTADRNDISWQTDLINMRGGTNGGMLQRAGVTGSIAGGISFPTRYLHQTTESAHKADIQAVIDLCVAAIETLDKHHWEL